MEHPVVRFKAFSDYSAEECYSNNQQPLSTSLPLQPPPLALPLSPRPQPPPRIENQKRNHALSCPTIHSTNPSDGRPQPPPRKPTQPKNHVSNPSNLSATGIPTHHPSPRPIIHKVPPLVMQDQKELLKQQLEQQLELLLSPTAKSKASFAFSPESADHRNVFRPPIPRKSPEETLKATRHREMIIQEIVQTEITYVQCLRTVVDTYMRPLRDSSVLTAEEITRLFSNVELLLNLHQTLLDWIQKPELSGTVGEAFMKMTPFLKLYTQYINNYKESNHLLVTLSKEKRFLTFLQSKGEQHINTLSSLMVTPIQRLPRYELLLQELLKNTDYDHPDYADLSKAAHLISDVASFVNSKKAEFENQDKIWHIQNTLLPSNHKFLKHLSQRIVKRSRRFTMEGHVILHHILALDDTFEKYQEPQIPRKNAQLFLFNDSLLVALHSSEENKPAQILNLFSLFGASTFALESIDDPTIHNAEVKSQHEYCLSGHSYEMRNRMFGFKISYGRQSRLVFIVSSEKERDAWLSSLRTNIEQYSANKMKHILLTPNPQPFLWARESQLEKLQFTFTNEGTGNSVDMKERKGRTCLHIGARWGNLLIVKHLISVGANLHLTDDKGYTAVQLAAFGGHDVVVKCLEEKLNVGQSLGLFDQSRAKLNNIMKPTAQAQSPFPGVRFHDSPKNISTGSRLLLANITSSKK